jgi:23S rRNA (guanosine2251-2'-O)-methyltransferase
MGRNCLSELLKHDPSRVEEVLLAKSGSRDGRQQEGRENRQQDRKDDLRRECERLDVAVTIVSRAELDALTGSDSHQGVAARVSPRPTIELEDLLASLADQPFGKILALDGVLDPHNLGAILRAAECFGVDGVIWSKNRSAPVGPVVSKVSVGASEIVSLCPVPNLHRALETLKKAGWWLVGAAVAEDASSLDTFAFPEKTVVVLGSEGEGMHDLTERTLDFKAYIPMEGQISSLNVSQATAVFLAELARQHRASRTAGVAGAEKGTHAREGR